MKIVLATDGSGHARLTEAYLEKFPFAEPPHVMIVSVCPVPDLHYIGRDVSKSVNDVVDRCRAEGRDALQASADRCQNWAASVETALLDGHAGQAIVDAAEKHDADLIALGARGIGGMHRFLLGSVSERVAKYAPCSVLVVHGDEQASPDIRNILMAFDGSPSSQQAVQRFASLPLGELRQLHILSIAQTFVSFGIEHKLESTADWSGQLEATQRELDQATEQLRAASPNLHPQLIQSPSIADQIIETAKDRAADLIVVGSAGRTGWERILLGSVSSKVLHHAPCSVWLERVRKPQSEAQ